jgi:RecB family exonuclease
MALDLVIGPPNSGRAGVVKDRVVAVASREPVLVVPTGDDVSRFERELATTPGAALGVTIRTFGSLFTEVAAAVGASVPPPLSDAERLALVRAAVASSELRLLARSAARPGFAPALAALITELQAALVTPRTLATAAGDLEEGDYETELARIYGAYVALRERAGRADTGVLRERAVASLHADPSGWRSRPVIVYGFDDLTEVQLELVRELARTADVTVAVNYEDSPALAATASLYAVLRDELGGVVSEELPFDPSYTERASLRQLDRNLFTAGAATVEPDGGVVLLESAGELGEAEAIGLEIAYLLAAGEDAGGIAVAVRQPSVRGPLLARVLRGYGIPVALEADLPLAGTAVGRALTSLCRAAMPEGAPGDLIAHLRADPATPAGLVDWAERAVARGEARAVADVYGRWSSPPLHLMRLHEAADPPARMRALARSARDLAERAHRDAAPLAGERTSGVPFDPIELRAAEVAAALFDELASVGTLPGCEQPDLAEAIDALAGATVRAWRGPASGRVRILSPYRVRAGTARYLFCAALQEGEFPAAGQLDPLLGEDRRAGLGIPALRRREQAEQERYLFHACVSRPVERLYLSWHRTDDEGMPLARSPFVEDVLDLFSPDPESAEERLKRIRGLADVVAPAAAAPTPRELARALVAGGHAGDPHAALNRLSVGEPAAAQVVDLLAGVPDPEERPKHLHHPLVLEALAERRAVSAGSLEQWLECPYRWFVQHELRPQRLEPEPDPLWLGGVVHRALERLYREAPGADSIPRPQDVGRWKRRFGELLREAVVEAASRGGEETGQPVLVAAPARELALARALRQVEAFLDAEAESETELRPNPDLLERRFGFEEEGEPALEVGEGVALHGVIDRVDVSPDGRAAVVRDYKTSRKVPGAGDWEGEGKLQLPLYMRAVQDITGLEPIAGLYQPLGATGARGRRPRGIALAGDPRLEGLDLVRRSKDVVDAEAFNEAVDAALATARRAASEMRAGLVDRAPLGGRCPDYCQFQAICRLERALGVESENGGER